MHIFESVDCPKCPDGVIACIVEDNKVTSHGICPKCEKHFGPEKLQFYLDTFKEECDFMDELANSAADEAMRALFLLQEIEDEVYAFNMLVWDVFFDELYQQHLDEMGGC